jgi:hypothetical protein
MGVMKLNKGDFEDSIANELLVRIIKNLPAKAGK